MNSTTAKIYFYPFFLKHSLFWNFSNLPVKRKPPLQQLFFVPLLKTFKKMEGNSFNYFCAYVLTYIHVSS